MTTVEMFGTSGMQQLKSVSAGFIAFQLIFMEIEMFIDYHVITIIYLLIELFVDALINMVMTSELTLGCIVEKGFVIRQ